MIKVINFFESYKMLAKKLYDRFYDRYKNYKTWWKIIRHGNKFIGQYFFYKTDYLDNIF